MKQPQSKGRPGTDAAVPHFAGVGFSLIVVSLATNLLMLTGPVFMLQVYDRVLTSGSVPTLVVLFALVATLYAFYAFLDYLRGRMATRFANVVDSRLSPRLFASAVGWKAASALSPEADPIRDGDVLRQFLASPAPLALLDLPWLPLYLVLIFLFHVWLGWLAAAGATIVVLLMIANEAVARISSKDLNAERVERQSQSDDAKTNAEAIIAMAMLDDVQRRWAQKTAILLKLQKAYADRVGVFSSATKGIRFLLQSAVLALGAYLVILGEITGGLMIAASIITSRALAPVEQVVGHWRNILGARQAHRRIKALTGTQINREPATALPLPVHSLSVAGVASGPPTGAATLITGINFNLTAGDGLGVLGPSGAGKSTLVRTLVGVWPPRFGSVRLDGVTTDQFSQQQIGEIIGYLPQRVELLSGTIAENICRFSPEAKSEDIVESARVADVHDLIVTFPQGYDTPVGDAGQMLSAGQRQRIGLARALYNNPFLVVLDEPNSNLDADGDIALNKAIGRLRERGSIVVVVAHRPSAIAALDKVLYLNAGRQMAFGPKTEVLPQITGTGGSEIAPAKKVASS